MPYLLELLIVESSAGGLAGLGGGPWLLDGRFLIDGGMWQPLATPARDTIWHAFTVRATMGTKLVWHLQCMLHESVVQNRTCPYLSASLGCAKQLFPIDCTTTAAQLFVARCM